MTHIPRIAAALLMAAAAAAGAQEAFSTCGALQNAFGPFDYRTATKATKQLVEGAHFTPPVEALISGATAHRPGGDIDYTLRVFPNNPRALIAVIRLGEMEKSEKPSGMRYTVDCWLERAVRFQPNDTIVRMIRAGYYGKRNMKAEALADLEVVERIAEPDNPFTHYNLGLSYMELGQHEKALAQAHKAMALGLTRTELRDRLVRAGRWQDPPAAPEAAASAASAPASASRQP